MFDPISAAIGAGVLFTGYIAGLTQGRRQPKVSSAPVARCGCEHGLNDHDPTTKTCHGKTRRNRYNKFGDWTGNDYVPCTCQQYVGSVPIEQYFPTQLLPPIE